VRTILTGTQITVFCYADFAKQISGLRHWLPGTIAQ